MKKLVVCLLLALSLLGLTGTAFAAQVDGNELELLYDDRKDLSALLGQTVTEVTIGEQVVTSNKVGTTEQDTCVLLYEDGILYAVGTGTAKLTVDGTDYSVTVSPAPLSIFMITGHSIGAGEVGNAAQSVVVEAGQGYSTFRSSSMALPEGGLGYGSATRPAKIDAFAPGQGGNKGVGSGIAWQWNQLTGEKAWVINMAVSGSCLNEWLPGVKGHHSTYTYHYDTAVEVYSAAQTVLKNEIAAGHYTLGHMVMLYHNGANFVNYPGWSQASIEQDYKTMWEGYKRDLAMDVDGDGKTETVEALGMIPSWKPTLNSYAYDKAAAYYMSASSDYPDIFLATNATRDYLSGDLSGFPEITYTTQSKAVTKPESVLHTSQGGTSDNSLFCASDKAHLSQVTYNMVGIDEAQNVLAFLRGGKTEATAAGFVSVGRDALTGVSMGVGETMLLVPEIDPVYGTNVTFTTSDGLTLSYPLQVTATAEGVQTLTASVAGETIATLEITVSDAHTHCACGGHGKDMTGHGCESLVWTPWGDQESEKTRLPGTTGNYYLVSDITLAAGGSIDAGQSVNLCLNGYDVTCGAYRFYYTEGDLSVTDCGEEAAWGTVTGSYSDAYGGLIYQSCNTSGAVLNIYGGNFDSAGTNCWGGILLTDGVTNIYGGNFDGTTVIRTYVSASQGTRDGRGGCFYVLRGTLNVHGGDIYGGTAQNQGGNIHVANATFNMTGGHVYGGKLDADLGSLTDGEAATGANISVSSGTATISGGTVSGGVAPNGGNISVTGGKLTITGTARVEGGEASGRGGNAYATAGTLEVAGGTVTGGYAKTSGGNLAAYSAGKLIVSGGVVEEGNAGTYGGNVSLVAKATLTVTGGIIRDGWTGTDGTTGYGGNIYGGYSSSTNFSTITISGGTISGGKSKNGGNVDVDGNGFISGGLITGGEASYIGGNVYKTSRSACTLTISGGTIEKGACPTGGNLYSNGKVVMTDGTLTDGAASGGSGGNVYLSGTANMTVSGGNILDGTAKNGGNIMFYGTLTVEDGLISNGYSTGGGGNLYVGYGAELTVSGGIIEKGSGSNGGNLYFYTTASESTDSTTGETILTARDIQVTISGGIIRDGNGRTRGGNVFMTTDTSKPSRVVVNMTGGTFSSGTGGDGTNIVIRSCGDWTMTGGTVTNSGEGIRAEMISSTKAPVPKVIIGGSARLDGTGINLIVDRSVTTSANGQTDVRFENLTDEFITVQANPVGQFATADADYSKHFLDENGVQAASYADGVLTLAETEAQQPNVAVYSGGKRFGSYTTFADAVSIAAQGGDSYYVKLEADIHEEATVEGDFWVDLNGHSLSGLTLTGTLYGMDSATNGYTDEACGKVSVTGNVAPHTKTTLPQTGAVRRYLAVQEADGSYGFHRFYFGITHVTMRTADGGIGYKATFAGSGTVKEALQSFGLVASLENAPETLTEGVVAGFTSADFAEAGKAVTKTVLVENIFKEGLTPEELAQRGQSVIYTRSYLQTKDGTLILSTAQDKSLRTLVETIDGAFDTFSKERKAELIAFYGKYETAMSAWSLGNLHHTGELFGSATALDAAGFLALLDGNKYNSTNFDLPSGTYYLTEDVDLGSRIIRIAPGSDVTLCLGGKTLSGNARIFNLYGQLNLHDCCGNRAEGERGTVLANSTALAPVFYAYYNSVLNLYGGDLTATKQVSQAGIGALSHDGSDSTAPSAKMNMYGGRIYGGNTTGAGGNLAIFNGGEFRMYGGEIYGGTSATNGGNIRMARGTVELLGGRVYGGSAASGGNVYINSASALLTVGDNMVLSGGKATSGGNLYITTNGGVNVGAALLEKGSAEHGGNVYLADGEATFKGTRLIDGTATNGGNYATKNKGSATFEGVTFSGGKAEDGGNLYIYKDMYGDNYKGVTVATLTLTDCTVTGGEATHLGGGIYAMESSVILSGNTSVTGNGNTNVYLDAGQTLTLQNLAETAQIGVSMCTPGKVTADTAFAANLQPDDKTLTKKTEGDYLVLAGEAITVPELTGFSVGWSRDTVTSPFPVPLDGMGKNVERMETYEIVSELTTSLIVMADETGLENAVVLCTMDTIVIPEEFASAIATVISDATGIPVDRIFLSGTHTHAAVSLDEIHESTREYLQWLYPRMARYAVEAVEDLAPVTETQVARTNAEGLNRVRRFVDAEGNAYSTVSDTITSDMVAESDPDTEIQVLRFVRYNDTTAKDDVILVNWQSHPGHVASASNGKVSSEAFGVLREVVEETLPHTKCAFFQGAAGNQNRGTSTAYVSADGNTYNLTNRIQFGQAMAAHVVAILENPTIISTGEIKVAHYDFDTEPWYKSSYTGDKTTDMRLSAVSIGGFAFVTAPYEMFSQNGMQIKDFVAENALFDMVFVIENSGGSNKYIAAYESFVNDERDGTLTSFEVTSTRFVKGIAEELVTHFAELLTELSGKDVTVPDFRAEAAAKYD